MFGQDENWKCFNTYLAFESYHRDKDCSIDEYLSEFDMRLYKLEACKVKLPDAVIACRLLKSCSLSDMHFQLALSTVPNMTFEDMRCTLKKLFVENKICDKSTGSNMSCSKVETACEDVMYGEYQRSRGRLNRRFFRESRGSYKNCGSRNNPLNKEGNVSTCAICGSRMHWAKSCPHSYERTVDTL